MPFEDAGPEDAARPRRWSRRSAEATAPHDERAHGIGRPIRAARTVPVAPATLFGFLADLENHWRIAERFVRVVRLEGEPGRHHGSVLRVHGPLGIARTTRAAVEATEPERTIEGTATVGRRTRARVRWRLDPVPGGTAVTLTATVLRAGPLDRALLLIGGRWWLRRGFEAALRTLAETVPDPGAGGVGPERPVREVAADDAVRGGAAPEGLAGDAAVQDGGRDGTDR